MTEPFDWAGLYVEASRRYVQGATIDAGENNAAAYLRTRIEAAFVPKRKPWCETCGTDVAEVLCAKCGEWWRDNDLAVHEATARAEAAEARVKVLEDVLKSVHDITPARDTDLLELLAAALGGEHVG